MLISRLWAFTRRLLPRPPPPLSFVRPLVSVSPAPEGDVHQALAAGDQLRIGAPAGKGGTGFSLEAQETEEERDGDLSVSGGVRHLEEAEKEESTETSSDKSTFSHQAEVKLIWSQSADFLFNDFHFSVKKPFI